MRSLRRHSSPRHPAQAAAPPAQLEIDNRYSRYGRAVDIIAHAMGGLVVMTATDTPRAGGIGTDWTLTGSENDFVVGAYSATAAAHLDTKSFTTNASPPTRWPITGRLTLARLAASVRLGPRPYIEAVTEGATVRHEPNGGRSMFNLRTWAFTLTTATVAAIVAIPGAAFAYDPTGTEPTIPYAQPADAVVPKRGCQTIAANPATPPGGSIPAVQVIYAWHEAEGDRYEASVQEIAKIVDRIDWLLDESTNYDQHVNLSCKYTPNSTYSDYAHALVAKEKIEAGTNPWTSTGTVRDDLINAGFDDSNRYYLVFTDFSSGSDAYQCPTTGGVSTGVHCSAIVEHWDSGVAGHELIHVFGAGHTWATENNEAYWWDIMVVSWDIWLTDHGFNYYYDPSETSASFHIDAYPSTVKVNIAGHPALTAPTCCDVGYSNDLLTAQERTIEASAPWSAPTGFSVSGAGWFQVTPPGSDSAVSSRYYSGRRSLTMNVQSHGEAVVAVTRKPSVTAGQKYRFFTRMTTNTSGNVRLRMAWYNSSGSLISSTTGSLIALSTTWTEYTLTATAPAGATSVQVQTVSPSGQSFAYLLDALALNHCNSTKTPDGCRMHITEL